MDDFNYRGIFVKKKWRTCLIAFCLVIHNLNYILALTGGIDSIIKQKKEELEDIKVDSYFQKKSSEVTEDGETTEKPKKKAKKWVDLDKEGFDDIEGSVHSEEDDEAEGEEDQELDGDKENKEEEEKEEEEDKGIGLVEIPEDDPIGE